MHEDGLGLWEAAARRRGEEDVAVVVRVVSCISSDGVAFAVHGPEEPQDEHDSSEHHATQAERLQSALAGREEGGGPAGDDEEDPDEDGPVVEGRHGKTPSPERCQTNRRSSKVKSSIHRLVFSSSVHSYCRVGCIFLF